MYIVPTLIKILLMNYLPQYIVSVVLSKRFKQPQERNRIVHVIPFLVIPRVLIDQNYVAIVFFLPLKVIPLKLIYYQTFFETWRNEHS